MRSFLAGSIVGGLLLILYFFMNNPKIVTYSLLLLGIIPIIISGLLSGTFASGDRVRANYSGSTDFTRRTKTGSMFFLFGLPCFLAGLATTYFI